MKNKCNCNILISIIIPCYNAANFLDQTISSLVNQDSDLITSTEIILIDDASDDNNATKNKINELSKRHNIIKAIYLYKNNGQAAARNAGLKVAKGKYVGFVDADDIIDSSLFTKLNKSIATYSDVDVIIWGLEENHYDANNNLAGIIRITPSEAYCNNKKDILNTVIQLEEQTIFGYLWNKLYKKTLLYNNNIFIPKEHLIEDVLFNVEVFKCAKSILCIDESFYFYARRTNENKSVTSSNLPDYFEQYTKKLNIFYKWFKNEKMLNDSTKKVFANEYVRCAMSAVWRNKNTNMSKKDQKQWLQNFYNCDLTKNLLPYVSPNSLIAKTNAWLFKNKHIWLILMEASLINFITNNMSKTLIKLRQSR